MRRILGSIAVLSLLVAVPLRAQIVRGRVVDAGTGEGVPGAAVAAVTLERRGAGQARTGPDGGFTLSVRAAGTVRLRVDRTGYRQTLTDPMPVGLGETIEVEVGVSAAPLTIAPLRVTARVQPPRRRSLDLNGYYDRERQGIGRYARREEIEGHKDFTLAQALSRMPGTAIQYVGTNQYITFLRYGGCRPRVYVDGMRVTVDAQNDINAVMSPENVEAFEIYRGASEIPVQYNDGRSACGVILVWTRHEP